MLTFGTEVSVFVLNAGWAMSLEGAFLAAQVVMILLVSAMVLITSAALFQRVAGSLNPARLNVISFVFFVPLLLQSFIGAILVVCGVDKHYTISRLHGTDPRLFGWLCVVYAMIAIPVAMWMAARLVGCRSVRRHFRAFAGRAMSCFDGQTHVLERYVLWGLSAFSLASIVYVCWVTEKIPIVAAFEGATAEDLARLRIVVTREFPGVVYVKTIGAKLLAPMLTYVAFAYWQMTKRYWDAAWFLVMALASVFILMHNMEKAPVLWFFIGFLFQMVLIRGRMTLVSALIVGLLVGVTLTVQNRFTGVTEPVAVSAAPSPSSRNFASYYNKGVVGRVILGEAAGLFLSLEHFPKGHPHLGFSSVSRPISSLLGVPYSERSARIIMERYRPEAVVAGTAGVMNSLFMAEAWANFGWAGVLLAPWWVGFVVELLFVVLLSARKTPLLVGLATSLTLSVKLTGGFNDFFYNPALLSLAMAWVIARLGPMMLGQVFGRTGRA